MRNAEYEMRNERQKERNGKTVKLIFAVIGGILLLSVFGASDKELTGRQIVEMANNANQSEKGMVRKGYMELIDMKSGDKEKREFTIVAKKEGDNSMSMFRFTDSSYKGTTFLTLEKENGNLMYIFLKSIGSPRQVEGSDKEANFVDTDISNEDMGGGETEDYTYERLPDQEIKGMDCYVIERHPKDKNSKYSKHLTYISKEYLIAVAMKSYSREGRVVKTIKQDKMIKVSDNIYVAGETEVTDVEKKHKTLLVTTEAKEEDVQSGYFNRNRMDRKWSY